MSSGNAPNRDAFLRRLENKQQKVEAPSVDINEDTLLFLEKAGINVSIIDSSSLKALDQIVPPSKASNKDPIIKSISTPEIIKEIITPQKGVVVKRNRSAPVKETININSKTTSEFGHSASQVSVDTLKKPASRSKTSTLDKRDELSDSEKILERLEMQNALILDMQRRIENLTGIVQHMATHNNGIPPPFIPNNILPPLAYQEGLTLQQHNRVHIERNQRMVAPNPPPQGFLAAIYGRITKIPSRIRESKTCKLWRLFWSLHRRHVRLDGGLLFKVFMVITLFSAKMMSRKKASEDAFWSAKAKSYLVVILVVTGFLIQSGYFKFFYRFFIKESYIERVYRGEDINANDVTWDEPPNRRNNENRNNNLRNMLPRNNLLAGEIPRPNGFNIFTDILILLCSFVLSLLPVWKPAGPQDQQDEANNEANAQEENIARNVANNNGDDNGNNNGQQN